MTLDEITAYPRGVLDGTITAGKYIRLACQRFFAFMERDDMVFDLAAVERVVTFISHLKHFKGEHARAYFKLSPWQVWVVASIYGFKWKASGARVTTNVYLQVARKNGKSTLCAAIAAAELVVSGEEGAEVDVVANSAKQALNLFEFAQYFAASIDPKHKYLQVYRHDIRFNATKSKMQVLASKSSSLDGLGPSCVCFDEFHEQKDSRLYDVLKSGMGARRNGLFIILTTAGLSTETFCHEMRCNCVDILQGLKTDDTQFSAIFELDTGDDYRDPSTWIKANPNLGVTAIPEKIQEEIVRATNNKTLEGNLKTKNFDMWLSSSDGWLQESDVQAYSQPIDESFFYGREVFVGVDLASTDDLTAVSIMAENSGKYYFKTWYYLPHSALVEKQNRIMYRQWYREKHLKITEGNVTDYSCIIEDLLRLRNAGVTFNKIAYDKYNSVAWAIQSEAQGLPLEPFSQALWNFNKPCKEFERLFRSGNIVLDSNPITRWCFKNACLKYDHNENCKPVKAGSHNDKIDGTIAILQALGVYLESPRYTNDILFI